MISHVTRLSGASEASACYRLAVFRTKSDEGHDPQLQNEPVPPHHTSSLKLDIVGEVVPVHCPGSRRVVLTPNHLRLHKVAAEPLERQLSERPVCQHILNDIAQNCREFPATWLYGNCLRIEKERLPHDTHRCALVDQGKHLLKVIHKSINLDTITFEKGLDRLVLVAKRDNDRIINAERERRNADNPERFALEVHFQRRRGECTYPLPARIRRHPDVGVILMYRQNGHPSRPPRPCDRRNRLPARVIRGRLVSGGRERSEGANMAPTSLRVKLRNFGRSNGRSSGDFLAAFGRHLLVMVGEVVAPQGLFSADFWCGRACVAHDRGPRRGVSGSQTLRCWVVKGRPIAAPSVPARAPPRMVLRPTRAPAPSSGPRSQGARQRAAPVRATVAGSIRYQWRGPLRVGRCA